MDWTAARAVAAQVAGIVAGQVKALTRDQAEPYRKRKLKLERKFTAVMRAYLGRVARRLDTALKAKTPTLPEDDDLENELYVVIEEGISDGLLVFKAVGTLKFNLTSVLSLAKAWARAYARGLSKGIQGTTQAQLESLISQFDETSGMTIRDFAKQLTSPEVIASRAEMIAVTETTRAYAEANQLAAQHMADRFPGVTIMKKWATNNDDIVCETICKPLNQKEVEHDATFDGENMSPPAHPGCRCWMLVYPGDATEEEIAQARADLAEIDAL